MSFALLIVAAVSGQGIETPIVSEATDKVEVAYGALAEGRNHEAIASLTSAREASPSDPAALINLGTAYARVGKAEKARECFEAAARGERFMLQLADGSWVDSRRAARMALAALPQQGAFASR